MSKIEPHDHPAFDEFVATIAALRAPDGCPWDKEQTHKTIAPNMIEEAYEAVDAIEASDIPHIREELGDVLLQVVLQSQIAEDEGEFTIDDVCNDINAKIVRRHPHVFGEAEGGSANDVITLWDKIKLDEKQATSDPDARKRLLSSVSANFPALMQAQKISRKAAAVGFEWETIDDVWKKVAEEIDELKAAYEQAPKDEAGMILHDSDQAHEVELELGDVLFSIVNVARRMGINSENALRATCRKFRSRWEAMEDIAYEQKADLKEMSAEELNSLWDSVKADSQD